jgi:hypothetical protein
MNKNSTQNIVLSILDKDGSKVKKIIKKILKIGKPCIPFLLKLSREHYENDFEDIVNVYIPYYTSKMVSYVDNGNFFTPGTLALYLVESIKQNREIHARSLSGFSFNIKLAAQRHNLEGQLIERLIYEMNMEVALRAYERWWEMVENNEISFTGDNHVWTWCPEKQDPILLHISPQVKEFASLDLERLRVGLPHHEITQEEWEKYSDRQKCSALGLKSSIYLQ